MEFLTFFGSIVIGALLVSGLMAIILTAVLLYLAKKSAADDHLMADNTNPEWATDESPEVVQIVAKFKIFLIELRKRIVSGEISAEWARELVSAEKTSAFDRILETVVLDAKNIYESEEDVLGGGEDEIERARRLVG